jgi:hypothetical protein
MTERSKSDSDTSPAANVGRSTKGYSADPGPERPVPDEDPVPLVPDSEVHGHARKPDEGPLPPTGRAEPKCYGPNDRLMGADR